MTSTTCPLHGREGGYRRTAKALTQLKAKPHHRLLTDQQTLHRTEDKAGYLRAL